MNRQFKLNENHTVKVSATVVSLEKAEVELSLVTENFKINIPLKYHKDTKNCSFKLREEDMARLGLVGKEVPYQLTMRYQSGFFEIDSGNAIIGEELESTEPAKEIEEKEPESKTEPEEVKEESQTSTEESVEEIQEESKSNENKEPKEVPPEDQEAMLKEAQRIILNDKLKKVLETYGTQKGRRGSSLLKDVAGLTKKNKNNI